MKKLLALILILALMPVIALGADYSAMSDDELWTEMKAIQAELWARSAAKDGVVVPAGEYIIGEDIPAGTYRLVFNGGQFESGRIFIYEGDDPIVWHLVGQGENVPEIGKIELLEGQRFQLLYTTAVFYEYTGLFN